MASIYANLFEQKNVLEKKKESKFHTIGLEHQHSRRFTVLKQQHGHRDVMCKRSIADCTSII